MKSYRIIHLPDFHKANQYQKLLLGGLHNTGLDVGYGMRKVYYSIIDLSIFFTVIKKDKIDIIHLHWLHPFLLDDNKAKIIFRGVLFIMQLLLVKVIGIKLVWTVHNLKNHENRFVKTEIFFSRIVAKLVNAIIAHCDASRNDIIRLLKADRNKIIVIPHGNYLGAYKNSLTREESRQKFKFTDDDFVFVFLGLLRPYKGVLDLIESFQHIDDTSAKLLVAGRLGSQDLVDTLPAMAAGNKNILLELRFIADDEIETYMKAADVVVLPYREIMNSGSAILGMSFGKVIIAPRLGCIPEVITGAGGILYDPGDKNGLLAAMNTALASKDAISGMGKNNYELARQLDWTDIAASTARVYRQCLAPR
jgi:beta-1,4-mannosyltransferase